MKITKEALTNIIKEEINEMMGMQDKLSKLLDSGDPSMVMTGIDVASSLGMPIIINNPVYAILKFVSSSTDPELLTLLSDPANHKKIQSRVARNQNTPIEVIKKIATGSEYNIRAANYAQQSLDLYCNQHPDSEACTGDISTTGV